MKNLVIVLALFSSSVAFGQSEQEIFNETSVQCVATLGITSMLTESDLAKMVFERDAKWWRSVLAMFVERAEADSRIETEMKVLNARWSDRKVTWDQLLDLAKMCSEMKIALESANE